MKILESLSLIKNEFQGIIWELFAPERKIQSFYA